MNSREKFLETMRFNPKISVNKREFWVWRDSQIRYLNLKRLRSNN